MDVQPDEKKPERKKKKRIIIVVGKRKKAVARAHIAEGTGRVIINSVPLALVKPRYTQMRITEAIMLTGEKAHQVDINVSIKGGGVWGQADAARTAIANALVAFHRDEHLKQLFLEYDRSLLISDSRRTEPHKPSRSSAGPRRSKQQSKR